MHLAPHPAPSLLPRPPFPYRPRFRFPLSSPTAPPPPRQSPPRAPRCSVALRGADAAPEAVELARTNLGEQLRADCRRAAGGGAAAEGATGAAGAAPPDLLSEGESLYLAALGAEASLPALGAEASLAAEVAECDLACEVRHPRPGRDD
jgi:hypothetical protein